MKLTHVRVTKYRCIEDSTEVPIEPDVTAFVGRNESGKSAFLEALRRLNAADGSLFDVTADYPRTQLGAYRHRHDRSPDTPISVRLELENADLREVEKRFGKGVMRGRAIIVRRNYKNQVTPELPISEALVIKQMVQRRDDLDDAARAAAMAAETFKALTAALAPYVASSKGASLISQLAQVLETKPLHERVWSDVLEPRMPRFVSFGEEHVMPGAIALSSLLEPHARHTPGVSTVLALLEFAGVKPEELDPKRQSYEELKSRIESAALAITDELDSYWSSDKDLIVTIDVANAGENEPGYAPNTPVLRIRIGSRRLRSSLPLGERSRGFAWFFSFLVRLCQIGESSAPTIVLLDEPGLSLHAGVQTDFLRFLEQRLGPAHQVIYTTHSPFMLDTTRLDRARAVSFTPSRGTQISADLGTADANTLMPLRAALGATLVEGLLPKGAGATLVVRDPSDLVWLRVMSMETRRRKKPGLDPRFEIVPLGGAAALVPYALVTANSDRRLVLLVEGGGAEREQLSRLVKGTLSQGLAIVSISDILAAGKKQEGSTIEDLLDVSLWLSLVTEAHKLSPPMSEDELGKDGCLIARTIKGLEGSGETLDRLRVADAAVGRIGSALPPRMVDRFVRLFEALNAHLPKGSK